MGRYCDISELLGKTLVRIDGLSKGSERVEFIPAEGPRYVMHHQQDCCEMVDLEDVCGDVADLLGSPILLAEEVVSDADPPGFEMSEDDKAWRESFTWTFYKLATINGFVTIRWYGESNGYYSEGVDFQEVA
jgi:hypothetical protein